MQPVKTCGIRVRDWWQGSRCCGDAPSRVSSAILDFLATHPGLSQYPLRRGQERSKPRVSCLGHIQIGHIPDFVLAVVGFIF
jgi:hypothetical protein